jgi:ATP-dependent 26S proteasome regulatory subunit
MSRESGANVPAAPRGGAVPEPQADPLGSICNIARMLQQAMIMLEDVDLVFVAREESMYGAALGKLIEQLDGFNPTDRVTFIMTTNAIDRVERAIRDRPGRVSQCLYFGPLTPPRRRYRTTLLERHDCDGLDLDRIICFRT